MDPYSQYNKQLEYYRYVEKQRNNYTDLSDKVENEGDSIYQLSKILFGKKEKNLNQDLMGIIMDDTTDIADVFCMLLEIILYGFDIISSGNNSLMDLEESFDDIIYTIKSYLKSAGFDLDIEEIFTDDDISIYRDSDDYYCEVLPRPPEYLCFKGWYVLNYRIIYNNKFRFYSTTPLENFRAIFVSKRKKIFRINFRFKK